MTSNAKLHLYMSGGGGLPGLAVGLVSSALQSIAAGPSAHEDLADVPTAEIEQQIGHGGRRTKGVEAAPDGARLHQERDRRRAYERDRAWLDDARRSAVWFEEAGLDREAVISRLVARGTMGAA